MDDSGACMVGRVVIVRHLNVFTKVKARNKITVSKSSVLCRLPHQHRKYLSLHVLDFIKEDTNGKLSSKCKRELEDEVVLHLEHVGKPPGEGRPCCF